MNVGLLSSICSSVQPAMTRKTIEELRKRIESEIREKSNKPRFCYMGYTPPLCIGDSMLKVEGPKEPPAHKEAMKVPYPKQGSFFFSLRSLSVWAIFSRQLHCPETCRQRRVEERSLQTRRQYSPQTVWRD
jgi:hypothetical protein